MEISKLFLINVKLSNAGNWLITGKVKIGLYNSGNDHNTGNRLHIVTNIWINEL